PLTLIFFVSQPISLLTAQACAANASLISIRSRSAGFHPAFSSARRDDGTGPMPMIDGSTPDEANARILAKGLRPSCAARSAFMTSTAAAPSLIPDALPAVTLPCLSNAGRNAESASSVAPALMNSSLSNATGSPLRCGSITGTISSLNLPAFCGDSHVVLVVDIPQAVDDHAVDQFGITHAKAVARARKHVRGRAHIFLAAGDDDVGVAATHRLRGQHHRLQSRAADLVDRHRRNLRRQSSLDRRL